MRTEKALYNLFANLLLQLVTALVGFILPAFFIQYYGSSVNGMIGSIKQFIAYLSLVEAGVGAASIAALYAPLLHQNNLAINKILSATKMFYQRSGLIFLALLVSIACLYPWLVSSEIDIQVSFLMTLIIGCSGILEFFFVGKYRVLLRADQKSYIISFILAATTALNALVAVVLILQHTNVLLVQAVATAVQVAGFFAIYYYVNKTYPQLNFKSEPDFKAIDKRWSAFMHQIAGMVVFHAPVVLITIFCGLKYVSIYVVYNMVFAAVQQIVAIFSNGLMAGFGEIMAAKQYATLKRAYDNYEFIFYGILAWAYTCTALLIMPFINIYTAKFTDANYVRPDLAFLFVIIGVANNLRIPPNTLVTAAGHFKETQNRALLEAGINLTVSLILVQYWGIVGILMGSVCSYAYRTLDFIFYVAKHFLQASPYHTCKRILINALLAVLSALPFVSWFDIQAANYGEWFLGALVIALFVFIIVTTGNALTDLAMFKATLDRLKGVVRRGKISQ